MRKGTRSGLIGLALLAALGALSGQTTDVLTDEEQDKLRESQDPSQRIEAYLDFAQARLDRFEGFRTKPADSRYDNGAYLDSLLGQYIAVNNELKDWIDDQYEREGDMRRGLRVLLERGPKQLQVLLHFQQTPDAFAADYRNSLREATENLKDTLDGATQALANQQKRFSQLKSEEKAEAHASKERAKEEKKRDKEEKKLRKRERKRNVPADSDDN